MTKKKAQSLPLAALALAQPRPPSSSKKKKQAIDKYTIEKDIAAYIKKEFDRRHSPLWHCVVGRNFGTVVGENGRVGGRRTVGRERKKNLSHSLFSLSLSP